MGEAQWVQAAALSRARPRFVQMRQPKRPRPPLVPLLLALLLLAGPLAGCTAPDAAPTRSTTTKQSSAPSTPDPATTSTPTPTQEPVAAWSPLAWAPMPCDNSRVRAMPRNAPAIESTNGTGQQTVTRLAAALGLTVLGSDPLRPDEVGYASQAWALSRGRVVEHLAAETGKAIEWSYYGQDRATGATWVADGETLSRALLADLGGPAPAVHRVGTPNATEVLLSLALPLDLGEITMLQVLADKYGPDADDGTLQVRLHPLHHVVTDGLQRDRSALTTTAREFIDCWAPQRSNYRSDWTRTVQPPFPVVRGDGLRLRVPYLITTEAESCFVTVDVDAQTGAIWDVSPELAYGVPLDC